METINITVQETMPVKTVNVTSIPFETKLSKAELRTLFYVGRKLRLIGCYVPLVVPQERTVYAHKSYGYLMTTPSGRQSRLGFEPRQQIFGVSVGNGFYQVKIVDPEGQIAAHYELL